MRVTSTLGALFQMVSFASRMAEASHRHRADLATGLEQAI